MTREQFAISGFLMAEKTGAVADAHAPGNVWAPAASGSDGEMQPARFLIH